LKFLFLILLVVIEVLASFFTGWGVLQYLQQSQLANPIVMRVLVILAIGITSGFISRLFFRKRQVLLRLTIPLFSAGLALFVLDMVFPQNYDLVIFDRKPWSQPVWIDLIQVGLAYLMSLLALFIGARKRAVPAGSLRPVAASATRIKPKSSKKKAFLWVKSKKDHSRRKVIKKSAKSVVQTKPIRRVHSLGGPRLSTLVSAKPRRFRRKDVKLLGETEHRCPYCLELVKKNDARGVVICPECKTWHHKDCWDITGSCQVAHRHDL
jgi:hypothetical protein